MKELNDEEKNNVEHNMSKNSKLYAIPFRKDKVSRDS